MPIGPNVDSNGRNQGTRIGNKYAPALNGTLDDTMVEGQEDEGMGDETAASL